MGVLGLGIPQLLQHGRELVEGDGGFSCQPEVLLELFYSFRLFGVELLQVGGPGFSCICSAAGTVELFLEGLQGLGGG